MLDKSKEWMIINIPENRFNEVVDKLEKEEGKGKTLYGVITHSEKFYIRVEEKDCSFSDMGFFYSPLCRKLPPNQIIECEDYLGEIFAVDFKTVEEQIRGINSRKFAEVEAMQKAAYRRGYTEWVHIDEYNHTKGENQMYTKILKDKPNHNLKITFDWLVSENCCQNALSWFVKNFGFSANYENVLTQAKVERNDSNWLLEHKKALTQNNPNQNGIWYKDLEENDIIFKGQVILISYPKDRYYKVHKIKMDNSWRVVGFKTNDGATDAYRSLRTLLDYHIQRPCNIYLFNSSSEMIEYLYHKVVE